MHHLVHDKWDLHTDSCFEILIMVSLSHRAGIKRKLKSLESKDGCPLAGVFNILLCLYYYSLVHVIL
jgi:hypothetical protein